MSKTKGFITEFKKFIARGNVLDLAALSAPSPTPW